GCGCAPEHDLCSASGPLEWHALLAPESAVGAPRARRPLRRHSGGYGTGVRGVPRVAGAGTTRTRARGVGPADGAATAILTCARGIPTTGHAVAWLRVTDGHAVNDATLATDRAATYRILGRMCLAEIDARLLTVLRGTPTFANALDGGDHPLLAALRVEYTRLFLLNAPPYESVWVDTRLMLNTDLTVRVQAIYDAGRYLPTAAVGAPDHVGLEL